VGRKISDSSKLRWKQVSYIGIFCTPLRQNGTITLVSLSSEQSIMFVRDITRYKRSEEKIKNQLNQLAALRSIDMAITSGLDLNSTLSLILDHVQANLNIDAASILLLDPHTKHLDSLLSGFPFAATTSLRVGEVCQRSWSRGDTHANLSCVKLFSALSF
jgi:hypothetical protein